MVEKYFIKIDLHSIKVNENAGSTVSRYPTNSEIEFSFAGDINNFKLIEELEKKKLCYIREITYPSIDDNSDNIFKCNGLIFYDSIDFDNIKCINITTHLNYVTLQHLPVDKYSYQYEDINIICSICGESFKLSELEYLENDDDWNYDSTETGCPICLGWDCCEIYYETIENALIRKQK